MGGGVLICFIVSVWRGSFTVYLLIDRLTWNSWSSCLGCAPPHPAVLRYSHHTLLWERFLRNPVLEKLANPFFFFLTLTFVNAFDQSLLAKWHLAKADRIITSDVENLHSKPSLLFLLLRSSPFCDSGYRHHWAKLMHDMLRHWSPWVLGCLLPVSFHSLKYWRRDHSILTSQSETSPIGVHWGLSPGLQWLLWC